MTGIQLQLRISQMSFLLPSRHTILFNSKLMSYFSTMPLLTASSRWNRRSTMTSTRTLDSPSKGSNNSKHCGTIAAVLWMTWNGWHSSPTNPLQDSVPSLTYFRATVVHYSILLHHFTLIQQSRIECRHYVKP